MGEGAVAMTDIGTVAEIWRYPVSSAGGERLQQAEIASTGVVGDRLWCLLDPATGEVAEPERRKRWRPAPDLLARNPERPELRFSDGAWLAAVGDEARTRLARHFGFAVEVRPAATRDGAEPGSVRPRYERKPIHLLTTASLRALSRLLPDSAIDPRRFRPNLVVEAEGDRFVEQGWMGLELTIGSARLKVAEPCARCAFTVLAQQELELDRAILPSIVEAAGGAFGILCSVLAPGAVRVGDRALAA